MIRSRQHPNTEPRRSRLTIAMITGVVTGASRALTSWLLDYLTTGN